MQTKPTYKQALLFERPWDAIPFTNEFKYAGIDNSSSGQLLLSSEPIKRLLGTGWEWASPVRGKVRWVLCPKVILDLQLQFGSKALFMVFTKDGPI